MEILNRARHGTSQIDPATPIADVRFVVADTELTGLDEKRDRIVSIGAVSMNGGIINVGAAFYRLANPGIELSPDSVVIHGITPSEVREAPPIETALAEFCEFADAAVLVGHFISIDMAFLDREMKRISGQKMRNAVIDTYSLYEWLSRRTDGHEGFTMPASGYRLYDIVKLFGIPVSGAHNAIMDAYTTALLFQRFLPFLADAGCGNIGDLLRIGKPFKGGDRFRFNGEFSNF